MRLKNAHRWKFAANQTISMLKHDHEKEKYNNFLYEMISLMGTLFSTPETEILTQGNKAFSMYFIVSGACYIIQDDV